VNSSNFTDRVRQALLLSTLISANVKLRKRGNEFVGLCPFHNEKSPSFTVSDEKGLYYCFGCGAKGDHFNFLMEKQGMTFPESMERLSQMTGIPLPATSERQVETKEYDWLQMAASWFHERLQGNEKCLEYLHSRGLNTQTIHDFKIGYAPAKADRQWELLWRNLRQSGAARGDLISVGLIGQSEHNDATYPWFRDRIVVPICDARGRVVAFGGRLWSGEGPKYLNSPETKLFHKGKMLFAHHLALPQARETKEVFIVEGYFDVITLFQHGIMRAVAPLGTGFTQEQLLLAWKTASTPIICFDGDAAGLRAATRILEFIFPLLKPGYSVSFMRMPEGQDPDSFVHNLGAQAFLDLAQKKISLVDFLWQYEFEKAPLITPEQKADFAQRLQGYVKEIRDYTVKSAYMAEIKKRLFGMQNQGVRKFSPPVSLKPRVTLSQTGQLVRQQLLLLTVINHPYILSEDIEVFSSLHLGDPDLENLKMCILEFVATKDLEKEKLLHYLEAGKCSQILGKLLADTTLKIHGRFAEPDASEDMVKEGWRELIFQIIKKSGLRQDIQIAKQLLKEQMSQDKWARLKALIAEEATANS